MLFPTSGNSILSYSFNPYNFHRFFTVRGASAYPYVFMLDCKDQHYKKQYIEIHFHYMQYGLIDVSFESLYEFGYRLDSKHPDVIDYDVFVINVFDFSITNLETYFERVTYQNPVSDSNIELIFIDLPKFQKALSDCSSSDIWIYLLKNGVTKSLATEVKEIDHLIQTVFDMTFQEKISEPYQKFYQDLEEFQQRMLKKYGAEKLSLLEEFTETPAKKAFLNVLLFEHKIKAYPYRKLEEKDVNVSAIEDDTHKIVFSSFRQWMRLAKEHYPDKDFTVIDEQKIVNSFVSAAKSAIYILFTDTSFLRQGLLKLKDRQQVLLGLINARVSLYWYFQYIKRTEKDYQAYVALEVIKNYFDNELSRKIAINDDFWRMLSENINLYRVEESSTDNEAINDILTDISNTYLKKFLQVEQLNITIDIGNDISNAQLEQLILDNLEIFRLGERISAVEIH